MINEPKLFVGRSSGGAIQAGVAAVASSVRQIPPPAAATHNRQGAPEGADALPQLGAMASAVTRPDSLVDGPHWLIRSKNWPNSPGTSVFTGPIACQAVEATLNDAWYAR